MNAKLLLIYKISFLHLLLLRAYIPGGPKKTGTVDFLGLCSDQQLSFFTSLDRASLPHYNNAKIIKFGWELFIYNIDCSVFIGPPGIRNNRGAVVAQWIDHGLSIVTVPGSNLLAAAVVPLGKALYPHRLVPRKGLKAAGPLVACL